MGRMDLNQNDARLLDFCANQVVSNIRVFTRDTGHPTVGCTSMIDLVIIWSELGHLGNKRSYIPFVARVEFLNHLHLKHLNQAPSL